jgi:hypothetical protein
VGSGSSVSVSKQWAVEAVCQSVTLGSSVEATVYSFCNSFSTNNFICITLSVRGNVFNLFGVSFKFEFLVVVTDSYRLMWYNSLCLVYTCLYFWGIWCSGCSSTRSAGLFFFLCVTSPLWKHKLTVSVKHSQKHSRKDIILRAPEHTPTSL